MKNKTKKMLKKLSTMIVTAALAGSLTTPVCVQAADWQRNHKGWWWQEDNGSYPVSKWEKIGGKWYHFNAAGYMDSGWYKEGGYWYYLGGANDGAMKTGWQLVDGLYYYMYSDGRMAANTWIDQYYVGADGAWIPNAQATDQAYTVQLENGQTTVVVGHFDMAYAQQVVTLVNQFRAENGLAPLTAMNDLSAYSRIRSYEIAYYFDHTRPNGTSCYTLIPDESGYGRKGENIAAGYKTPEEVVEGWINSPGHRANMLGAYNCIGVGCFIIQGTDIYKYYWVQMFGNK